MFSDIISQTIANSADAEKNVSGMIRATCWQGISAQEFSMKVWNLRFVKMTQLASPDFFV